MNHQIVWCDIPVTNLDRAIKFYSAVIGATVTKETHGDMSFGLLPHVDTSVGGCLIVTADAKPSVDGPLVYLNCAGRLDAAVAAAESGGGKVITPKHPIGPYGFKAVILDSEGNRIALHSN